MMIVVCTLSVFKGNKEFNPLLGFTTAAWLSLLLFTIKFFPFVEVVLTVAVLLSLLAMRVMLNNKFQNQIILLGASLLLGIGFYFTPTDSRYYALNINWNYEIENDFVSWDKYSWHLYNNMKYEASLTASDKAKQIVDSSGQIEWTKLILEHNTKIKDRK